MGPPHPSAEEGVHLAAGSVVGGRERWARSGGATGSGGRGGSATGRAPPTQSRRRMAVGASGQREDSAKHSPPEGSLFQSCHGRLAKNRGLVRIQHCAMCHSVIPAPPPTPHSQQEPAASSAWLSRAHPPLDGLRLGGR